MTSLTKSRVLGAAFAAALAGIAGAAVAQDKEAVVKNREALMKEQGKDLSSVKAYAQGKADLAQATTGAANLTQTTKKIADVFPPGTAAPSPSGKYAPKPAIWTDWNKFLDAQKYAEGKADALLVAVKSGNKEQITAASDDLWNNGCTGCHDTFRETLK